MQSNFNIVGREGIKLMYEELDVSITTSLSVVYVKIKDGQKATIRDTDFIKHLDAKFWRDNRSIEKILFAFQQIGFPLPEEDGDFVKAAAGALIMSNYYGVAIRIERQARQDGSGFVRYDAHPWILQPVASIKAGRVIVEICAGVHNCNEGTEAGWLNDQLSAQGINFYDSATYNAGVLPIKLPSFPDGVPIVVDRTGVSTQRKNAMAAKKALEIMGVKRDPQALLYSPLRRAFRNAWSEHSKTARAKKNGCFLGAMSSVRRRAKMHHWMARRPASDA